MSDQIDCTWEDILPDGELPGDVMVSILSYLPVKSLLRFKAVRKSWRSLISSPLFIKLHLNRQSVIANILLLSWENTEYEQNIGNDVQKIENEVTELSLLSHNYDISTILPPWSSEKIFDVVDSCKGLVCIRSRNPKKLILWNPATRRYRSIQLPKEPSFMIIGLGFVEATNDYKIVGMVIKTPPAYEQHLFVYTLSSDSWKKLDYNFKRFPTYNLSPTFINGCIHWLRNTCSSLVNVIFAFDVADEVMRCFGVPDNYDRRLSMQILAIKGCLSVVIFPDEFEVKESGIEIWVMVEYGVQGSWVKQFTIQGLTTIKVPLRSWKENEILFIKEEEEGLQKLMFYEPSHKKKNFFELGFFFTEYFQAFNYVESLASVD